MLVSFDEPPNAVKVRFVSRAWMLTRAPRCLCLCLFRLGNLVVSLYLQRRLNGAALLLLSARSVARRLCSHALLTLSSLQSGWKESHTTFVYELKNLQVKFPSVVNMQLLILTH